MWLNLHLAKAAVDFKPRISQQVPRPVRASGAEQSHQSQPSFPRFLLLDAVVGEEDFFLAHFPGSGTCLQSQSDFPGKNCSGCCFLASTALLLAQG